MRGTLLGLVPVTLALCAAPFAAAPAGAEDLGAELIAFCRPPGTPAGACVCSVEQIEHVLTEGEFLQFMAWRRAAGSLSRGEVRAAAQHAVAVCEGKKMPRSPGVMPVSSRLRPRAAPPQEGAP